VALDAFMDAIENALHYFGGIPKRLVIDNTMPLSHSTTCSGPSLVKYQMHPNFTSRNSKSESMTVMSSNTASTRRQRSSSVNVIAGERTSARLREAVVAAYDSIAFD
jgi:hypothetical protein